MARPKGSKNRLTRRRERKIQEFSDQIRHMLGEENYFDGDAHAFLMYIYKDRRRDIELRLDAAKAAISYEKPRLAAVAVANNGEPQYEQSITLNFVGSPEDVESPKVIDQRPKLRFVS